MIIWFPEGSINTLWTLSSLNGSSISTLYDNWLFQPSGDSLIFQRNNSFPVVAMTITLPASAIYISQSIDSSITVWIVTGSAGFPFAFNRAVGIGIRWMENIAFGSSCVLSKDNYF